MEAIENPKETVPDMGILDKLLAGKELAPEENSKVMQSLASGEKHYVDKTTGLPLINPDVKTAMAENPVQREPEVPEQEPDEDDEKKSVDEKTLTPAEQDKKEEIVNALKKDRKFTSKYGKDSIYAVATAKAKQVAEDSKQLSERINKPQGHKETADPISDDSSEGTGKVKKMMGNKAPVEVIANILARKK